MPRLSRFVGSFVGSVVALVMLASTPALGQSFEAALDDYARTYAPRLGPGGFVAGKVAGCGTAWHYDSDRLAASASGPLVLDHGEPREDVVILFHGLSDSPYYLCAVARELHDAGANVVLPLLSGHGLEEPLPEAHSAHLSERWMADAEAALGFAVTRGQRVSTGGLSTGGVLAVWLWSTTPETVDGGLLLFSAAFDFANRLKLAAGCAGTTAERANSAFRRWCYTQLASFTQSGENDVPWRWDNPYRQRFSDYGTLHLGILRRATLQALAERPFDVPLFIAHSVDDTLAPIAGVDALAASHIAPAGVVRVTIDETRHDNCPALLSDCVTPAPVQTACGVAHASVVLALPVRPNGAADGPACETANPGFPVMMSAARTFLATLPRPTDP